MCCDSTNAGVPGHSRSEGALRKSLTEFIGDCEQRVAVACFSSNVARIETIIAAAEANGRNVCLVGRSLWRMVEAARASGDTAFVANDCNLGAGRRGSPRRPQLVPPTK